MGKYRWSFRCPEALFQPSFRKLEHYNHDVLTVKNKEEEKKEEGKKKINKKKKKKIENEKEQKREDEEGKGDHWEK